MEKLFQITREKVNNQPLKVGERSWRERYCADMRTRALRGPEDYFGIDPEYRLWIWPRNLRDAVGRLNLTPASQLVAPTQTPPTRPATAAWPLRPERTSVLNCLAGCAARAAEAVHQRPLVSGDVRTRWHSVRHPGGTSSTDSCPAMGHPASDRAWQGSGSRWA